MEYVVALVFQSGSGRGQGNVVFNHSTGSLRWSRSRPLPCALPACFRVEASIATSFPLEKQDRNRDFRLSIDEWNGKEIEFTEVEKNGDGIVTIAEYYASKVKKGN